MTHQNASLKIVLTQREFEYVQQMLDYGSTMDQALYEVRPDLRREVQNLNDSVILVQRRPLGVAT